MNLVSHPVAQVLYPNGFVSDGPQARKSNGAAHVAIIMRTQNRPLTLRRSLESVLSQTHAAWCLYLVNDGGDSEPVDEIVAEYRSRIGERLKLFHNPSSRGMEAASNIALSQACGDYFVVHDDDDTWHPRFLERMTAFLEAEENRPYVAAVSHCTLVFEQITGNTIVENRREPWAYVDSFIDGNALLVGNQFPPISLLVRMGAVARIGLFNEALPVLGDWDFNLRIFAEGEIGVVKEPLAYWHHRVDPADRQYGNSVLIHNDRHQQYGSLYRNALLRHAIRDNATVLGALQAVLRAVDLQASQTRDHLGRMATDQVSQINHLAASLSEAVGCLAASAANQGDAVNRLTANQTEAFSRLIDSRADLAVRLAANQAEVIDRLAANQAEIMEALAELRAIAAWQRKLLRPVHWLWLRLLPVRRLVARLRGRI